jgi:hypothetical protein
MTQVQLSPGDNIQAAIDAHAAGTVFQLAAGTYRLQDLAPKNGDQFIGVPGHTILDGAAVVTNWTHSGGYWEASGLPVLPVDGGVAEANHPLATHDQDLFIDNTLYQRVDALSEVRADMWYFNEATGTAYISTNPTGHTVELSEAQNAFTGHSQAIWGGTDVVLQGLTVEKYATPAQSAAVYGGLDWSVSNCTVEWNHGGGVALYSGSTMTGGEVDHNGQIGITGAFASNVMINDVEVASNNYAGYDPNWEAGGIKFVNSQGIEITDNDVHDNNGVGIWGDTNMAATTITGNTVDNNVTYGILHEVSYAATIRGNLVRFNGRAGTRGRLLMSQIMLTDSRGVEIVGNEVEIAKGAGNGITMIDYDRGAGARGRYVVADNNVHDNIIIHDDVGGLDGMGFDDNADAASSNVWDRNTYIVPDAGARYWYFDGAPRNWTYLQARTPYERHGRLIPYAR